MTRIQALHADKLTAPAIAAILNAEGWRPPKRREMFTGAMVRDLLHRFGVPTQVRDAPCLTVERQGPTELTRQELASRLGMPEQTLYRWLRRGLLVARRAAAGSRPVWLITADEAEIDRLRELRRSRPSAKRSEAAPPIDPQLRFETHHGWQMENLIKAHKLHLASDRTSCSKATANQFRLLIHTAAYWLLHTLRLGAKGVVLARGAVRHDAPQPHQGGGAGHRDEDPHQAVSADQLPLPGKPHDAGRPHRQAAAVTAGATCP
ncbi:DDE family transposase [Azospirillum brasilense]|nr:DDE family transposase [Azospirillum brasilense]